MMAAFWAVAWGVQADTLHLHNGDRLTGTLRNADEKAVTFKTDYAGELTIKRERVRAIVTENDVAVRFKDGNVQEGRFALEGEAPVFIPQNASAPKAQSDIRAVAATAAQLVEDGSAEAQKTWSGTVTAGTSMRAGSTDTADANIAVTLVRKRPKNTLTLDGSGHYGEVDSAINTRRVSAGARWQYYPRNRLYLFGRTAAEKDAGRRLDLRLEAGGGVGYDVIKRERRTLAFDAGFDYAREYWNTYSIVELEQAKRAVRDAARTAYGAYLQTQWRKPLVQWTFQDLLTGYRLGFDAITADVEQETRSEAHVYVHLGARYEQTFFKKSVLAEALTIRPKIDAIGEYRLTSDLSFDTPLSDALSIRLNWRAEFDSEAGRDRNAYDNTFISALRYAF